MSINLLPQEVRLSQIRQEQKSLALVILILYGCLFVLSNGLLYYQIQQGKAGEAARQALRSEYEEAEQTLAQLTAELAQLAEEKMVLQELLQQEEEQAVAVAAIIEHLPPTTRLRQLQVTEEGWAVLSGESPFLEDIYWLLGTLPQGPLFREVVLRQMEVNRATGVKSFTIYLQFDPRP